MIRLELSNRDYNTIAEALLESALDWEHAADELGRLHQFCARTGVVPKFFRIFCAILRNSSCANVCNESEGFSFTE